MSKRKQSAATPLKSPWLVRAIVFPTGGRTDAEKQKRWDAFARRYEQALNDMKSCLGPIHQTHTATAIVLVANVPMDGGEATSPFPDGTARKSSGPLQGSLGSSTPSDVREVSPAAVGLIVSLHQRLFSLTHGAAEPDDKLLESVVKEATDTCTIPMVDDLIRVVANAEESHAPHGCAQVKEFARMRAALEKARSERLS